eukprot:TRINITY_DN826_c0_g1_i53.p1 TRINITY_DN826_c0_g1~~TRINITY_DN826_c0_g1_i53.p1  ORF type:complete len:135 (+),score=14.04 TRINITY_DN826_c0_g1_i53:159-563(+)
MQTQPRGQARLPSLAVQSHEQSGTWFRTQQRTMQTQPHGQEPLPALAVQSHVQSGTWFRTRPCRMQAATQPHAYDANTASQEQARLPALPPLAVRSHGLSSVRCKHSLTVKSLFLLLLFLITRAVWDLVPNSAA